jgi:hypothetical protein
MTWAPLLLANRSPCLRYLVLRDLLGNRDEASELEALRDTDPLIKDLVGLQNSDGSWGRGSIAGNAPAGNIQITAQALTRLGYLGYGPDYTPVRRGAEYLFTQQLDDGSWPLGNVAADVDGGQVYDVMSLQTSLPLRGLAECGYAEDPRAERAYDWLVEQRLDDGAWPTGIAEGVYGYVAGYRRLAHSRWGCRSNTTSALVCLSLHPSRRRSPEAGRALDLLLGRETRERHHMGYDVARTIGAEASTGFLTYYARFDVAQILGLCSRVGATVEDPRVGDLVDHVKGLQGPYGLWEYTEKPQASRWVTYDLLRSLSGLDAETEWVSVEPRTPFQPYPRRRKRF